MCAWCTASAASATSAAAALRVVAVGREAIGEVAAGDQLHGEVALALVLADLVDRHDAGVVEQRDRLGLVLEPPQLVVAGQDAGPDHLQGDGPVEADLAGPVDDAHAAAAELGLDLVVAEVADGGRGRPGAADPAGRAPSEGSVVSSGSAPVPVPGASPCRLGGVQGRRDQAGGAEPVGGVVRQRAPQRGQGWVSVMIGWLRPRGGSHRGVARTDGEPSSMLSEAPGRA